MGKTDDGDDKSAPAPAPFGSVKRQPTGPMSAGFAGPSSPWSTGPQSAGFQSPMGSFGNFGLPGATGPPTDKRSGPGSGRPESRFKNVLAKEGGDDSGQRTIERQVSMSGLSRVNENESWRPQDRQDPGNAALNESEEDVPTGSAALSAGADISPPHGRQGYRGFGTPSRQGAQDDFGFGAFGMTSEGTQGFGQARDSFQQTPAHQRMGQPGGTEQLSSPTGTNPYQSPDQHGVDRMTEEPDHDGSDTQNSHLPGLGGFGALPNLGRAAVGMGGPGDRSQTSSVGPNRGFPNLAGLGQLGNAGSGAWPVSQGGLGTPSRQTSGLNAFGSGIFANPMSDMQSPGLAGLGSGLMSPQGGGFGGRGMASMFPSGMQDQMHAQMRGGHDSHPDDGGNERAGAHGFGGIGDMRGSGEAGFGGSGFLDGRQDAGDAQFGAPGQSQEHVQLPPGSSASNQPPAPQQRTMVMPDRMRWIYRDPQGQTQGPWSGLEMHDWYKAGFFSPELLVKKQEDMDYEPLAQLIRRIGNSREPFLVPQIGIAHGPPAAPSGGAFGPGPTPGPAPVAGGAQPPFASSFPSFGTTLTADQQNALERRKQEEQYLMARQKEHLAQAQIAQRLGLQGAHPSLAGQLHHHGSAHSLQSQPSFGSITSPTAYQPSPIQGPAAGSQTGQHSQGFFDNSFRSPQAGGLGAVGAGVDSLGNIREEEIPGIMDRLNLGGNRAGPAQFGAPGQPFAGQQHSQQPSQDDHEKHIQQMLQDRAKLQQEQAQHDARQAEDERSTSNERLQQFQQLQPQAQIDARLQQAQQKAMAASEQQRAQEIAAEQNAAPAQTQQQQSREPLSLTEQVQKAASAKHSPAPEQPGLPQPFPPAPSQSPLPAPAAQRTGRQSVADQLQTESRDLSQTPSVDTPSVAVAPWAKEPTEAPKGPSLREIQEAEAKKAAEAEEMAAAARRAAFQREMEAQAQVVAPQPGLPTSSTWGAGSPATPTGAVPAAWAKTAQKPSGPTASKTLAQIQKEEEARKRRMVAAAAAQAQASLMSAVPAPAGGKSYANLAGKITIPQPGPMGPGGAWTTVGASGKVKTPAPTVSSPAGTRSASSGVPPPPALTPAAATTTRKPATASRSVSMANTAGAVNAQDEFRKWAVDTLRPDLKTNVNGEF